MSEINQNELGADELKKVSAGENKVKGFSIISLRCIDCRASFGSFSSTSEASRAKSEMNGKCTRCGGRLMIEDEWFDD